jgi:hypothetical protein
MENAVKKFTIYFDSDIHNALRNKAIITNNTISAIVNIEMRRAFAEDIEDLYAFEERANEPDLDFEDIVTYLKNKGKLQGQSQQPIERPTPPPIRRIREGTQPKRMR